MNDGVASSGRKTPGHDKGTPEPLRSKPSRYTLILSASLCALTVGIFLLLSGRIAHWFLLPILICGTVIGCDAIDWMRGRLKLFSPAGIIGVLGLHFFFLAPLLHVAWDFWMGSVEPPRDWRDWLGWMAVINAIGLVLYRLARIRVFSRPDRGVITKSWRLNRRRLLLAGGCALLIGATLQLWVYIELGGVMGYAEAFTQGIGKGQSESSFTGMGWIFTVSESVPIVALICLMALLKRYPRSRSWLAVVLILLAFLGLKLLFGGLRGSRASTIWALFWAAGLIHFWFRPLTRKFVFLGVGFLLIFMYLYGFYKGMGTDAWRAFKDGAATSELTDKTGRTFSGMLLGDLARADLHAFLLHRMMMSDGDYKYAWGRTYLGSVALLVPRTLWAERPATKVKEGTQAQYGMRAYEPDRLVSSRVYGLAGETMLNFGPLVVPLAYLFFGIVVGRLQRFLRRIPPDDMRLMLFPLLVNLCFSVLVSDSDNLLFNAIKDGLLPAIVVRLGSRVEPWKLETIEDSYPISDSGEPSPVPPRS